MSWIESKWYSILKLKCPRCHEGELFPAGTMYNPARFADMYSECTCCGQPYEPEPGYYYGAMYVSFGFNTALFIGVWVVLSLFMEEVTLGMMLVSIVVLLALLFPLIFRLSRAIWINIFVRYEGPCQIIVNKNLAR